MLFRSTALSTAADGNLGKSVGTDASFDRKVSNFFEDITKIRAGECAIKGGSCVAVAVASDSTYTGTQPGGLVTTDTYEVFKDNVKEALQGAIVLSSGEAKTADIVTTNNKTVTFKGKSDLANADFKELYTGAKNQKVSSKTDN